MDTSDASRYSSYQEIELPVLIHQKQKREEEGDRVKTEEEKRRDENV